MVGGCRVAGWVCDCSAGCGPAALPPAGRVHCACIISRVIGRAPRHRPCLFDTRDPHSLLLAQVHARGVHGSGTAGLPARLPGSRKLMQNGTAAAGSAPSKQKFAFAQSLEDAAKNKAKLRKVGRPLQGGGQHTRGPELAADTPSTAGCAAACRSACLAPTQRIVPVRAPSGLTINRPTLQTMQALASKKSKRCVYGRYGGACMGQPRGGKTPFVDTPLDLLDQAFYWHDRCFGGLNNKTCANCLCNLHLADAAKLVWGGKDKAPADAEQRAAMNVWAAFKTPGRCAKLCTAGEKPPPRVGNCSALIAYDYRLSGGTQVGTVNVTDWAECCAKCNTTTGCKAW